MEALKVVDRYTLDRLEVGFCASCREMVAPEKLDDREVCPFCSFEVVDYGSVIDAVCDSELASHLHRSE